ncbi:hypothetical protein RZS08_22865, partial [Arthrospira platensis SPKY1]|nr:hypothetical protein [Arthrospira platensis SPKY1]
RLEPAPRPQLHQIAQGGDPAAGQRHRQLLQPAQGMALGVGQHHPHLHLIIAVLKNLHPLAIEGGPHLPADRLHRQPQRLGGGRQPVNELLRTVGKIVLDGGHAPQGRQCLPQLMRGGLQRIGIRAAQPQIHIAAGRPG